MQIKLPLELKTFISDKKIQFPVKILSNTSKGTSILIGGRKIFVPFFLDKAGNYRAIIKNGKLEIQVIKNSKLLSLNNKKSSNSKDIKNILEELFGSNEHDPDKTLLALFSDLLNSKLVKKRTSSEDNENNKFIKNKDSFFFLFDLPIFNVQSKIAININKERSVKIVLNFYEDNEFQGNEIKSKFYGFLKSKSINALLYMTKSEEEFKLKIHNVLSESQLDIKV